ncbi:MAG: rhombosortase [bacterium]
MCSVQNVRKIAGRVDICIFVVLLALCNIHVLTGKFPFSLIFIPSAFGAGKWWQFITHPFVHVSLYHLLLDAGAFLMLYESFNDTNVIKKMCYVIACALGSVGTALVVSPIIYTQGLCGLSGIAHGLMAISGLEMMQSKENARLGAVFFLLVVVKSMYEIISGTVLFSFMHMGLCGTPVAACHTGGVLAGIISYLVLSSMKPQRSMNLYGKGTSHGH